ncbi:uncharacterized protein PF3D7_1120000-like [Palaemon carinicauda]|uniref:uncharacterized protein PF3D7_1120000-like n=1 Tax=Palaemon carinicauda TaxID=392227 RepID=UPI0035B68D24
MAMYAEAQRVEEEKEKLKEELMEEESLRKEKEGQLAILKENMESLQIQNLQEVETIKREIENRLNLVTEEAIILKHEKEEMEIKINRLEILAMEIDDIVKRQKREFLRNEVEKEKLKEELMREERLRKEKKGQIAILKENMESLQIQNLQEVKTINREIENRLNLVTEEAKILKHEKEEMEIKIDWLEILAMEIDDIVKRQKRELLRREEESKRLDKELIEERRIRKETESEVHSLKKEIESLKQRLLAKTGQIGDTLKVVVELADLMNRLEEEVNSDD